MRKYYIFLKAISYRIRSTFRKKATAFTIEPIKKKVKFSYVYS